jgi:hypothetical protein
MSGPLVGQVVVAVIVIGAAGYLGLVVLRALRGLRQRRREDGCGSACGCAGRDSPRS